MKYLHQVNPWFNSNLNDKLSGVEIEKSGNHDAPVSAPGRPTSRRCGEESLLDNILAHILRYGAMARAPCAFAPGLLCHAIVRRNDCQRPAAAGETIRSPSSDG